MLPAPTVHCTLPFCIELYSVYLLGLIILRNMVLTMNLIMTQRHESFCVGRDCSN